MNDSVRDWIRALVLDPAFTVKADSAQQFAKRLAKIETEGTDAMADALGSLRNPGEDSARQAIARKHRQELSRVGLAAYDTSRFVAAMLAGVQAGFVEETEAWRRLGEVAIAVQGKYRSWQQYVDAYEFGRTVLAGGHPKKQPVPAVPTLPWQLEMRAVSKGARTRYRRSKCGHCGGIKELPSKTPWVYCDFCGELCDYDFDQARAVAADAPEPTVEEERRLASVQERLAAALERGDRKTYGKLQREYFAKSAESSPELLPPRGGDPAYRAAWIEFMADATTAIAFHREAAQLEAGYHGLAESISIVRVKRNRRVMPETFPMLIEAFVQRTDCLAKLYESSGLLQKHPDRPTVAIWRHIEHAVFAQRWLPIVDEATAQTVIARLGLAAELDTIHSNKRARLPCHRCGNILEIVQRARRVTCEFCGHRLELLGT